MVVLGVGDVTVAPDRDFEVPISTAAPAVCSNLAVPLGVDGITTVRLPPSSVAFGAGDKVGTKPFTAAAGAAVVSGACAGTGDAAAALGGGIDEVDSLAGLASTLTSTL